MAELPISESWCKKITGRACANETIQQSGISCYDTNLVYKNNRAKGYGIMKIRDNGKTE